MCKPVEGEVIPRLLPLHPRLYSVITEAGTPREHSDEIAGASFSRRSSYA